MVLLSHAQTLVNREWTEYYGIPDTVAWQASTLDASGNLYTVGNTFNASNSVDVLLIKYDAEGNMVWQQTYDHEGMNDYGTAITMNANGEISVAAAVYSTATNNFDIAVLRYDDQGNLLWSSTHDRTGDYDVPTAIATDASGSVSLTAISKETGSAADLDFWTLRFDDAGNLLWDAVYDFNGGRDVPVSIIFDGTTTTVTGASSTSATNWDYFTVMYDAAGTAIDDYRLTQPGVGFDEPAAFARDAAGNFYLTGRTSTTGTSYQIQTIKLSPQLNVVWTATYTPPAAGNANATALGLDSQGNIYVCGYTSASQKDLLLIQYDPNGHENWAHLEASTTAGADAAATSMHINALDEICLTGYQATNNQRKLFTAAFDQSGNKLWERTLDDGDYVGGTILTDGRDAYVAARTFQNGVYQYAAVKYSVWEQERIIVNDASGNPHHAQGELVVRFDPSALKLAEFYNTDVLWGNTERFLQPGAITAIGQKLGINNPASLRMSKVFPRLRPSDTLSVTRLGDTLRLPDFWATLVLYLPPPQTRSITDEAVACDSLETIEASIWTAQENYIYTLDECAQTNFVPNDPYYTAGIPISNYNPQWALFDEPGNPANFDFKDGDINIQGAWDIHKGSPLVKIGVCDYKLYWQHEEFDLTNSGGGTALTDSRVAGGYNYVNNSPMDFTTKPTDRHGSKCAGIIGASTNNGRGMAGVAGGDFSISPANPGVKLYSLEAFGGGSPSTSIANSFIDGVIGLPNSTVGFALNMLHISGGVDAEDPILWNAVEWVFKHQATLVATRGNGNGATATAFRYPGCYDDDRVICVGGGGNNGELLTSGNSIGGCANIADYPNGVVRYDGPIDFVAPGSNELVLTIATANQSHYQSFVCSSASAPYVTGIAALLHGYILENQANLPNALAPEDAEQLIQRTAQDRGVATFTSNAPDANYNAGVPYIGYDKYTGWGLPDATAAMQAVQYPGHIVKHIKSTSTTPKVESIIANQAEVTVNEPLTIYNQSLPKGTYKVTVWKVEHQFNHINDIPVGYQVQDIWSLNSLSEGWPSYGYTTGGTYTLPDRPVTKIGFVNVNTVVKEFSYYYHFDKKKKLGLYFNFDKWYPTHKADAKAGYSLYLTQTVGLEDEQHSSIGLLSVAPNPVQTGEILVKLQAAAGAGEASILTMTDCQGRRILSQALEADNQVKLNIDALAPGIYCINVQSEKGISSTKFVKNN